MSGSYILVIFLREEVNLKIGALGSKNFKEGYYLYVGSAMGKIGSTTLINRVKRHTLPPSKKKRHWHIDYLLESELANLIQILLVPSTKKIECMISHELSEHSDGFIENFGSSDCNCKAHLYYFSNYNTIPFKL
jgi:sugar fermentation stimulation protein A